MKKWAPFLLFMIFQTSALQAIEFEDAKLDMSFGSGGIVSSGTMTRQNGDKFQYTIGGLALMGMAHYDLMPSITTSLQFQGLFDVLSSQMSRVGGAGSVNWHLFGGSKQTSKANAMVTTTSSNKYSISLVGRGGYFRYSIVDPSDIELNINGSLWEIGTGLDYRQSVNRIVSIGFIGMINVISLPDSVDRIEPTTFEVLLYLRTTLGNKII